VALSSGLASGVSPEARLSLALRRAYTGVFSPEFRAAVAYADGDRQAGANGSVELRVLGLALEACPLRGRLSPNVWLEPCVATRLALRTATGGPPSNPTVETSRALWADVGGLARAAFSVSNSTWLELSAEAFAPLFRERFYTFSPELTVYRVPRVGLRVAAGIGVAF
jgi:hypothetical protein